MERKVHFANQGFDIAVTQSSIIAWPDAKNGNLLNQYLQIIINKTARNLHDSKGTVARLSNMANAQNIRIHLLKFLAQLISWWRLEVGRQWVAIGHSRRE